MNMDLDSQISEKMERSRNDPLGYSILQLYKIKKYIIELGKKPDFIFKYRDVPIEKKQSFLDDSGIDIHLFNAGLSNISKRSGVDDLGDYFWRDEKDRRIFEDKKNQLFQKGIPVYLNDLKNISTSLDEFEPELRKIVHKNIENEINRRKKELSDFEIKVKAYKASNSNDKFKKQAEDYAQSHKLTYNRTNIRVRTEEITWVYNEQTNMFYLKNGVMLSIDGNDEEKSKTLNFDSIIYASTHSDIKAVDDYLRIQR